MTPPKKHLNVKPCLDSMADNPREERPMENVANSECKDFCRAGGLKTPHVLGICPQAQPLVTGPQKSSNSKWIHMEQWTDSSPSLMETPIHHKKTSQYTQSVHTSVVKAVTHLQNVFLSVSNDLVGFHGSLRWFVHFLRASILPSTPPFIHPNLLERLQKDLSMFTSDPSKMVFICIYVPKTLRFDDDRRT